MSSSNVDKIIKAINGLETQLKVASTGTLKSRKAHTFEREHQLCSELRDILLSSDLQLLARIDRRFESEFTRAIDILFELTNHLDQSLRTFAEETLDAIFRTQLLHFQHARVIVRLITVTGKNGPARTLVSAFNRLCMLVHYTKANRLTSFGVHIVQSLTTMLRRPEEAVQTALEKRVPTLFATLGPRLRDQHVEKVFELYRVAADNLELSGASSRAAVTVITQICQFYSTILKKAVIRCYATLRRPDDTECKQRLVGSLNAVKSIWPLIVDIENELPVDTIKGIIVGVLLCMHSKYNDVIEASLKCLNEIMSKPSKDMKFYPPSVPGRLSVRPSLSGEPGFTAVSSAASLVSSPFGSNLDLSIADPGISSFNEPLELPDRSITSSPSDEDTEGDIIDPLLHADLFEEQKQEEEARRAELEAKNSPLPQRTADEGIPEQLPDVLGAVECYGYAAQLVARKFLLAGLKGLKNDREARITHKILALSCLSTIVSKQGIIAREQIQIGESSQSLSEVARFVLHDDDGLCGAAIEFISECDKNLLLLGLPLTDMLPYCVHRVERVFQQKRKRALLIATTGATCLLQHLDLFSNITRVAINAVDDSYNLLKTAAAEWIAAVKWSVLQPALRLKWQKPCLNAFLRLLLFNGELLVEKVAAENFAKLVENAELGELTKVFQFAPPDEHIGHCFENIPVVLGLPREYSFRNVSVDFTIEENLELILSEFFSLASKASLKACPGLISGLSALVSAFPPSIYRECWQSAFRSVSGVAGLLALVVELAEVNITAPPSLIKAFSVVSALFAGQMEGQMMRVVQEQMVPDRKSLPKQLDVLLTERLLLLSLRVLNVYYSLVTEHKSMLHQATAGLIARPNFSLNTKHVKTASSARIASISRLLGTAIHPTKPSSFLESPSLKAIYPQIRGAYLNFLEKIGVEQEKRFIDLLSAALQQLCVLLEMLTYQAVTPLIDEILLYLKVLLELDPSNSIRLLHQLFKLVFGKNAANINLDTLQQLVMKHPLPPVDKMEMFLARSANEFTLYAAFLNRAEFLDVFVRRHVGWLRADMLSAVHVPPKSEISNALLSFEGFVNKLLALYPNYNSMETKAAILGVMCELPRDGVQYALADPNNKLFEAVLGQIDDMLSAHTTLLRQTMLYLIVLVRTNFIEWKKVEDIITAMLDKATERNVNHALAALDVVVCECLVVAKHNPTRLFSIWLSKATNLMMLALEPACSIWTLFLHFSRRNDNLWKEWSLEAWACYRSLLADLVPSLNSVSNQVVFLSCLAPQTFRPIDSFFLTFKNILLDTILNSNEKLVKTLPLFFVLTSYMTEDQILPRMEQLCDNPNELIAKGIIDILWNCAKNTKGLDDKTENILIFSLQSMTYCLRSERLPKLSQCLKFYTPANPQELISKLQNYSPRLQAHFLAYFCLTPSALPSFLDVLQQPDSHTKSLALLLLPELVQTELLTQDHLLQIFDSKQPLCLFTIADSKQLELFTNSISELAFEAFLRSAALETIQVWNVKAALDIITVAAKFAAKYSSIPCTAELQKLVAEFSPLCPMIEEHAAVILDVNEKDDFEGVPNLARSDCRDFLEIALSNPKYCSLDSTLNDLLNLPTPYLYHVFECLAPEQRERFITLGIKQMENFVLFETEPDDARLAVARAQEVIDIFEELVANDAQLCLHFYAKLQKPIITANLSCSDFTDDDLQKLLEFAVQQLDRYPIEILAEHLDGLCFVFASPSAVEIFTKHPFQYLSLLTTFMKRVTSILAQESNLPFLPPDNPVIEIYGATTDSELYKNVCEIFDMVKYITGIFRHNQISRTSSGIAHFERILRVVFRHPVLYACAMASETAIKMQWRPQLNVSSNRFVVPLVNIHLLCNIDVLCDFTWHINWLGWTSRQHFEDLWMSLFGVLSSTPTGTELTKENASHFTEQILASACAVSALTELLLSSLLYPAPGNPVLSHFAVKHRERTGSYRAKSLRHLSVIKARLLDDSDPSTIFTRNIERLIDETKSKYGMGQLSALALWNLTGVLQNEKTQTSSINSPRIRASLSEYLLRMNYELDTASSIRALFDNYSHWLSRGLEYISLPLLSATVRSMALLSDLIDDPVTYVFLFEQMRNIYNSRILAHHPDIGFIIYALLKSITVVGIEKIDPSMNESDLGKLLAGFVEVGLTSVYTSVREATLHGVLYFVQSMAGESLKPVIQYTSGFLINEISKQLDITDPVLVHNIPSSLSYEAIVWSCAFRIMEEPVQGNFKTTLNQKLCKAFLVINLSPWVLELITAGIESLIFHSSIFADEFAAVAQETFQGYQFHTSKFRFALRIFVACVFREEADPTRNSFKKFAPMLQAVFSVFKRCDSEDAKHLVIILPPVLRRLYNDRKALEFVLEYLLPSKKIQLPENSKALFCLVQELIRNKQHVANLTLTSEIVNKLLQSTLRDADKKIATSLLLTAMHSDSEVSCRFRLLLELWNQKNTDWAFYQDWILQKTAESMLDEGIALQTPLPDPIDLQFIAACLPKEL